MIVFTHPAMLAHETPHGHAERSERLSAVLAALAASPASRREAPEASRAALERVHSAAYLARIERAFPQDGFVALDPDTFLSPGSREAALRAAGAAVAAVDAVLDGEDSAAFCAVRPPGHHAEPEGAMGFCIYNNVGVGALHALEGRGLKRVAVLDFDVHHGNGTQALAERDARMFFTSTHQAPLYPGTGHRRETGLAHNVLNLPFPEGARPMAWRALWEREALPAVESFHPELILVSAGFDAHEDDPLAGGALTAADFAWIGGAIRGLAERVCSGRVVSFLEGGYALQALADSCRAYVRAASGL